MSIGNELSCDVATALLSAGQATPQQQQPQQHASSQTDLTELVLSFHATLRRLTGEERRRRRRAMSTPPPANNNAAAAGS